MQMVVPTPAAPPKSPATQPEIPQDSPYGRIFDDREPMIAAVREYAFSQGFVITIARSSGGRNMYLGCDRGGVHKARDRNPGREVTSRRKRGSRRSGCPFSIYCYKSGSEKSDNKWRIRVINLQHNHDMETNLVEHSGARVMTEDHKKMIEFLLAENLPPRKIVAALKRGYPNLLVLPRDIYNLKKTLKKAEEARRQAELPEERAKRERLEQLAEQHKQQREHLEAEQKKQRVELENAQKEQREYMEKHGNLEGFSQGQGQVNQDSQLEQLEQLQQLQQLQQFDQLEQLSNHVRGGV